MIDRCYVYEPGFIDEKSRAEILAWLANLHPLWEMRYSTKRPPPAGKQQRGLLRRDARRAQPHRSEQVVVGRVGQPSHPGRPAESGRRYLEVVQRRALEMRAQAGVRPSGDLKSA